MNCSVSHGENDTNICELQHVWNVHPALLWIAPWNFLPLSWSPPTQTSGVFQRTVLDHKVQDRILVFAASIHMFDASTFLMSIRLTSPKKLVLKPLFFMVKSQAGVKSSGWNPCLVILTRLTWAPWPNALVEETTRRLAWSDSRPGFQCSRASEVNSFIHWGSHHQDLAFGTSMGYKNA